MGAGGRPGRRSLVKAYWWLRQTFPAAFGNQTIEAMTMEGVVERAYRPPLKVGIIKDILAHPGRPRNVSKRAIHRVLEAWTLHDVYLMALASGARRITLDGAKLEGVSRDHAAAAKAILQARRANRRRTQWNRWEREAREAPEAVVIRKRVNGG